MLIRKNKKISKKVKKFISEVTSRKRVWKKWFSENDNGVSGLFLKITYF